LRLALLDRRASRRLGNSFLNIAETLCAIFPDGLSLLCRHRLDDSGCTRSLSEEIRDSNRW
jgi:hypothetical protein